jgi:hypothetical protein
MSQKTSRAAGWAFLSHQLQALLRRERGYDDGEVLTSPLGEGAHNWSDLIGFVNHDWPRKVLV